MRTVALWLVLKLRGIHIGTEEVGVGLVVIPAETQLFLRSSRACLGKPIVSDCKNRRHKRRAFPHQVAEKRLDPP